MHPYLNSPSDSVKVVTTVGPYLAYDLKELTLYDKTHTKVSSWPGTSGENGQTNPHQPNGPIPEGKWWAQQKELQQNPHLGIVDQMAENFAKGEWAGGEAAWGKQRVQVYPCGADKHGRLSFYIHGGKKAGSKFGIDLTDKIEAFVGAFKQAGQDLVLVVKYGVSKQKSTSTQWKLGSLSMEFETGGRGSATVSTGVGDAGGVSYGSYQMTSTPDGGTVTQFVQSAQFPWCSEFVSLSAGTKEFTDNWKNVVNKNIERFKEIEHQFIKKTHYDPLVEKVKRENNLDANEHSKALKNVVWSTAVQHGKNTGIIVIAINNTKAPIEKTSTYDEKLIKEIYLERGRKKSDGKLVYFSRNAQNVQDGVTARYKKELPKALEELRNEGF